MIKLDRVEEVVESFDPVLINSMIMKGKDKILLVEGRTDSNFIEQFLSDDIYCEVANKAFKENVNNKNSICYLILSKKYSYVLSKKALDMLNNQISDISIYGMVDLDYDNPNDEHLSSPMIFVTDTHDLETLLLSTDNELLQRLENCNISIDDSKKAFCLAYQLALINQAIYDVNNDLLRPIQKDKENIEFEKFIDDYSLSIIDFLNYLQDESGIKLSKKEISSIMTNKTIKKFTDSEGKWKEEWESFSVDKHPDFWELVNGHYILSLIRFVNSSAKIKYLNLGETASNRRFEIDIINNYDSACFGETNIAEKMKKSNVIL